MPYAVVVTFVIKPQAFDEFLYLMWVNARKSLEVEAGCHQFDISTDPDRPNEVFLYEIYTDRAAFEAHLTSDHFKSFDGDTAEMTLTREVRTYTQVVQ
ncbi:putative quinol monooxygenase [Sulfitobacter sp.]|uniref:putative quinol monooxygenase n=1 Tax=Sulfitobacter sp. TaxID=1903071 RepID=UPI003001960D